MPRPPRTRGWRSPVAPWSIGRAPKTPTKRRSTSPQHHDHTGPPALDDDGQILVVGSDVLAEVVFASPERRSGRAGTQSDDRRFAKVADGGAPAHKPRVSALF